MVVAVVVSTVFDTPHIQPSDDREFVLGLVVDLTLGAGFLTAAAVAEVLRRGSLASLANPLGPVLLRFTRDSLLGGAIYILLATASASALAASPLARTSFDDLGIPALVLVAAVLAVLGLGLVLLVWVWRARPYPPLAVRLLRDVELAVATEAIDRSVDTRPLRAAWESVVGPAPSIAG